ncbi:MAG: FHA domain-containing protein [Gammaproteobacteria bacterium]|nr:FHA domain-containing protein [Gammaproteobacteria bacterium]
MAKLLLKYEGVTLSTYKLEGDNVSIGRLADNGIQLDDPAVSGYHARVVLTPNAYLDSIKDVTLEDLGSTNGTLVNDEKVDKQLLKHGDNILIGKHLFIFDSEQGQDLERTAIYIPDSDQ